MNIKIGVPIHAADGQTGFVDRILLDPASFEVDGVVARAAFLLDQDTIIPVSRILTADDEHLSVEGTSAEINDLPHFSLSQYTEPPEEWIPPVADAAGFFLMPRSPLLVGAFDQPQPLAADEEEEIEPDGDVEVAGSTTVYATDGPVGKVDRVITAGYSDEVTHIVLDRDGGHPPAMIPVESVATMAEEGIRLTLSRDEVLALPEFDADDEE